MDAPTDGLDRATFEARFMTALADWTPSRAELLAAHAWAVAERNKTMNLTRITAPEEMAVRHAMDSLAAAPLLASEELGVKRVLDLGTGAGWPGLALAIALPHVEFTLLDARKKKVEFLKEVVAELGLEDQVDCVWGRFEEWVRQSPRLTFRIRWSHPAGTILLPGRGPGADSV